MNNNLNNQHSKPIRKNYISLIFGIIGMALQFIMAALLGRISSSFYFGSDHLIYLIGMILAGVIAIFGIYFGIKELKSEKKTLGILGILISLLSLMFFIWELVSWWVMEGSFLLY